MSSGFTAATKDAASELAAKTVGLVTKKEFTRAREELEASIAEQGESSPAAKKKKKKKAKASSSLSFADEEEAAEAEEDSSAPKKPKLGKNPNVDTSMLFDADRQAEVERKREELARVWTEEQDAIKAEKVAVTYSYHDPSGGKDGVKGNRNTVEVPKGFTIEQFLNKCREQVPQLRSAAADQIIYIKEDLIMPHSMTFYELIVNKARGKSGPLFQFDVHDDVRMKADARVEKDESHPGKVMFRNVYERNKEKFPYSRFEVYDPQKKWDSYTTHGGETYGEGNSSAMSIHGVMRTA